MYCPKCGYEYREGYDHCPDCDEQLVDDIPEEDIASHEYFLKSVILTFKLFISLLKSRFFLKTSQYSYKLLAICLLILNYFTFKDLSYLAFVTFEIPVSMVRHLEFLSTAITFTEKLCLILLPLAIRWLWHQKTSIKIAFSLWFCVSVGTFYIPFHLILNFIFDSKAMQEGWWTGMIIPCIFFAILVYQNSKIDDTFF